MKADLLYEMLLGKGFPEEYCKLLLTKYLTTEYTQTRMLGYLFRYENPSIEDVTDEMLAILSDREQHIKKKEMEYAQAKINEWYLGREREQE